jgi:hypothetical protein
LVCGQRLAGFRPEDLSKAIENRRAVRIALMRSTIHLVSARDCLALRPAIQPALDRSLYSGSPWGRGIVGMDIPAFVEAARALLEEKPRSLAELGPLLRERWPDRDANSMAYSIRNLVPLVQVPPRGLWGASGQAICTTAESWLGRSLAARPSPGKIVLRYLAAFGPATVRDIQSWSGLTGIQKIVDPLRPRLCTFQDESGRELVDLPGAPLPDPATPASPRFLPDFDNVLLAHADRSRIVGGARLNIGQATVLVDGFVRGTWKIARHSAAVTLRVTLFEQFSKKDAVALEREGKQLLAFVAPNAKTHFEIIPRAAQPLDRPASRAAPE